MFTVTLLPAHQGDCLWIEYGTAEAPHRILIDGGTAPTYGTSLRGRIEALGPKPFIDLMIVTHIDTDHIGGVLELLDAPPAGLKIGEVWFNAWRHIAPTAADLLGPIDGEILSCQLDQTGWKWNHAFRPTGKGRARAVAVPDKGKLPAVRLKGGMRLTVLSPGSQQLEALRRNWVSVCRAAGLEPGKPSEHLRAKAKRKGLALDLLGAASTMVRSWANNKTKLDDSPANGSTIAVLVEYKGRSCILPGDSFPTTLAMSLRRLLKERQMPRLRVDAIKVPHHGSKFNVTKDLLDLIDCPRFVFSTNGAVFNHPDLETIARVVTYGQMKPPSLAFNYAARSYLRSDFMTASKRRWNNSDFMRQVGYGLEYGDDRQGLTLHFS